MLSNQQTNTLSETSTSPSSIPVKWLLALVSATFILGMFYSSIQQTISNLANVAVSVQSAPASPASVSTNRMGTGGSPESVADVVSAALAFKAMLSASQQATLQLNYTATLARKWSNLPCGTSCRNGIQLGTNLTADQYAAATLIIQKALSSTANEGSDEYHQMNLAEAYLHANGGGSGYDSTLRWMCFLNTPSTTGGWMLQFGGHHYAANIAFNNGHVVGATPFFMGLEPKTFSYNGVAYDPLGDEKNALTAMLAALSTTELATAKLSSTFNDCVMIPGESNGGASSFPAVAIGQPCSSLTTAQQNLVLSAIQLYVSDMDTATANNVMAGYLNEIDQTYISYVGTGTAGNAASFLVNKTNYARISGPHVWIEFSCQGGIVIQNQIHYHTVWRDRSHDYGVDLSGAPIDVSASSGVMDVANNEILQVYPNPSAAEINMNFTDPVSNAKISVMDINGRTVYSREGYYGNNLNLNVHSFAKGSYFLFVRDNTHFYTGKFVRQ